MEIDLTEIISQNIDFAESDHQNSRNFWSFCSLSYFKLYITMI